MMAPPRSTQRRLDRVTRSSVQQTDIEKSIGAVPKQTLEDKVNEFMAKDQVWVKLNRQDVESGGAGGGHRRHRAPGMRKMGSGYARDFGEGSESDESLSSFGTEIVGGIGRSSVPWLPEPTEPVRRRSRGRPPKRPNTGTSARQTRRRNDSSRSRERGSLGEPSGMRRTSNGVKRKSDSMSAEFEIEEILDKYVDRDGITWYLILWKNYEKHESTWEPRGKLEPDGMETIEVFENKTQQVLTLAEGAGGDGNDATGEGDTPDNAGAQPQRSRTKRFHSALWQTSVDFLYGVIATAVTLVGIMIVFAYSYAVHFSPDS